MNQIVWRIACDGCGAQPERYYAVRVEGHRFPQLYCKKCLAAHGRGQLSIKNGGKSC